METSRYGRWFRMYDDALDDRKIHELRDKLEILWLNCLCFASKSGGTLSQADMAWRLRKPDQEVALMLAELHDAGCSTRLRRVSYHEWEQRQFLNSGRPLKVIDR